MVLELLGNGPTSQFTRTLLMPLRCLLLPAARRMLRSRLHTFMVTTQTMRCGLCLRHVRRERRVTRILWQPQGEHSVFMCLSMRAVMGSGMCVQQCVRKLLLPGDIEMSAVFVDRYVEITLE